VNTTGWLKGLRVSADGAGIVSHAGVTLVRALSDRIGLTAGLSKALASDRATWPTVRACRAPAAGDGQRRERCAAGTPSAVAVAPDGGTLPVSLRHAFLAR
jgi:hypothetical protein